ncbi:hypothetical protein K7432_002614 [Basidiobolus ranarum]|uniref:Uncharacterized protein n=1 Tax=Basidiobolus ranarum TaxID=34480 RepID=A0ABR2W7Y9_9FUNG
MGRENMKIGTCCFCISVRTATLILATLGALGNLLTILTYGLQPVYSFGYTQNVISYLFFLICCAGVYGVWKENIRMIRTFVVYYWMTFTISMISVVMFSLTVFQREDSVCEEVSSNPEFEMDMDTCYQYYFKIALGTVIASCISLVFNLYCGIAVWSYYRQISLPSDYTSVPQEELGKGGEKC